MATTQQYIDQLKIDKQNLVSMLNNMGVEATNNETFTSLTPKVGKIVTDPILQDKSIEITENGTTNIVADEGYNGLNNVEVSVNVEGSGGGVVKLSPTNISYDGSTKTSLEEELNMIDTVNMTTMQNMFRSCSKLTDIDVSKFNTSKVTNMCRMFFGCTALEKLDLSAFDMSNVTDVSHMCRSFNLKEVIVGNTISTKMKTCNSMFYGCKYLTNLDLSGWEFSGMTDMSSAFYGCTNLIELNLSSWEPNSGTSVTSTFENCTSLKKLDIRKFPAISYGASSFRGVPSDCEIIVKDDTARSNVMSNRSDFTNVKTVAEL